MKKRVPDIVIEQLLLGELAEGRARQLRADPQVQARAEELEASNREILERYPPQQMARRIGLRLEREQEQERRAREVSRARAWSLPRLAPVAGFAALLLIGGVALATLAPRRQDSEVTRMKGARPHLVVYRKSDGGAEALAAGSGIRAGDVLQIGYVAASRRHGMIFSIDGRGVLTLHFPAGAGDPTDLQPEGETMLDFAYRLDDAPGFERFFLVTANRGLPVDEVLAAGRRLASDPRQARRAELALPSGLEQWSVLLAKQ